MAGSWPCAAAQAHRPWRGWPEWTSGVRAGQAQRVNGELSPAPCPPKEPAGVGSLCQGLCPVDLRPLTWDLTR